MRGPFDDQDHDEETEVEPWLKEHWQVYQDGKTPQEESASARKRRARQRKKPPINVSNQMRMCRGCKRNAPKELFRKKRCLSCQIEAYLDTL